MTEKSCKTCKYEKAEDGAKVCDICIIPRDDLYDNWEPKEYICPDRERSFIEEQWENADENCPHCGHSCTPTDD